MVTVVSYLNIIWTKGANDMSDHNQWISYSHWGAQILAAVELI
jgi:hypothetical protein